LTEFVLGRAGEFSDAPALIDASSGLTITYAQLVESVRAVAAGLAERGFGEGEVFAHYAPNCPEYAVAFHAVATVGGVNTTANPLLTAEEFAAQLRDSGARLLVTVPELVEKATAAAHQSGVEEIFVYGNAAGATPFASLRGAGKPPMVAIDPAEDLVALPYSSGTTGLPKGVMLTHRNLVANICQTSALGRIRQDERWVGVLPFFHIYGLVAIMNLALYRGDTIVTMPRFELAEFLRQARTIDFSLSEARSRFADIDAYRIEMLTFMADFDVIVCPAMPTPAKPHHHGLVEISDFSHMMVHNLTGWPAAVVRCGTSKEGLPVGVQVVARPWEDATALAVAAHLEKVFGGWRPPPVVADRVAAPGLVAGT